MTFSSPFFPFFRCFAFVLRSICLPHSHLFFARPPVMPDSFSPRSQLVFLSQLFVLSFVCQLFPFLSSALPNVASSFSTPLCKQSNDVPPPFSLFFREKRKWEREKNRRSRALLAARLPVRCSLHGGSTYDCSDGSKAAFIRRRPSSSSNSSPLILPPHLDVVETSQSFE